MSVSTTASFVIYSFGHADDLTDLLTKPPDVAAAQEATVPAADRRVQRQYSGTAAGWRTASWACSWRMRPGWGGRWSTPSCAYSSPGRGTGLAARRPEYLARWGFATKPALVQAMLGRALDAAGPLGHR